MSQHIGIVACSAEGAALCYRTICSEAETRMGEHCHPEVSLHCYPLSTYMDAIVASDWEAVGRLMARSADKLAAVGADFMICPDNTVHQAFDTAIQYSSRPWLHIATAVADQAIKLGYQKVGITGTAWLMEGPVYPAAFDAAGIDFATPSAFRRAELSAAIFQHLVKGDYRDESRAVFLEAFEELAAEGCDSLVMGCTEIPILMEGVATPLPTLDSTRILARAAIERALQGR